MWKQGFHIGVGAWARRVAEVPGKSVQAGDAVNTFRFTL
jgi:hypothetical protein